MWVLKGGVHANVKGGVRNVETKWLHLKESIQWLECEESMECKFKRELHIGGQAPVHNALVNCF